MSIRIRKPGWRGLAASAAVIGIVAGLTYGGLSIAGVTFGSRSSAEPVYPQTAGNRDRLAICVQSVGFSVAEAAALDVEAKAAVELALGRVVEHPLWAVRAQHEPAPIVDLGCNREPALYRTDVDQARTFAEVVGRPVSTPSYYRVFVFVLPPTERERFFVNDPSRLTTEEVVCSGDKCPGLTTGLYLDPAELRDATLIADNLEQAVGLEGGF